MIPGQRRDCGFSASRRSASSRPRAASGIRPARCSGTVRARGRRCPAVTAVQRDRAAPNELADGLTIGGSPIFRVVMGPFATKDEAEKVGRASKRAYWVYEGSP